MASSKRDAGADALAVIAQSVLDLRIGDALVALENEHHAAHVRAPTGLGGAEDALPNHGPADAFGEAERERFALPADPDQALAGGHVEAELFVEEDTAAPVLAHEVGCAPGRTTGRTSAGGRIPAGRRHSRR
jgi:hypothetical protein